MCAILHGKESLRNLGKFIEVVILETKIANL